MVSRFFLVAVLLLGASHGAFGQVVRTLYSDDACSTPLNVTWTSSAALGQCVNGTTMYVATDGSAAYTVAHYDGNCTNGWYTAERYNAGPTSCMKIIHEEFPRYARTIVPAERNASALPFFSSWPPTDSAEVTQCLNNLVCSTHCVRSRVQRLGLCINDVRMTCAADGQFYHQLYYVPGNGQCQTAMRQSRVIPSNTPTTCGQFARRQYLTCPVRDADSSAAVTPSLATLPIVQLLFADETTCANRVFDKIDLFANASCSTNMQRFTIVDLTGSPGVLLEGFNSQCVGTPVYNETNAVGACKVGDFGTATAYFTRGGDVPAQITPLACSAWGKNCTAAGSSSSSTGAAGCISSSSSSSSGAGDSSSSGGTGSSNGTGEPSSSSSGGSGYPFNSTASTGASHSALVLATVTLTALLLPLHTSLHEPSGCPLLRHCFGVFFSFPLLPVRCALPDGSRTRDDCPPPLLPLSLSH